MPYEVKLTVFEGPLDLLLQLIERRELDITTVSLAAVTDQYLEYIGVLANAEPDLLTDFLVIAARLILIKSQALLPRPPEPVEQEEDLGQDLVRQLQEYKRFKEIAALLKERDEKGLHSYIRLATTGITPRVQIEGVVLDDLVEAMRRLLTALPEEIPTPDLARPQFTISEKIAVIETMISQGGVSFQRILSGVSTRVEAIVTFLALLEMIKQQRVLVEQDRVFGEIMIVRGNGNGSAAKAPAESSPE
jgi:segregation and condensation protein A